MRALRGLHGGRAAVALGQEGLVIGVAGDHMRFEAEGARVRSSSRHHFGHAIGKVKY